MILNQLYDNIPASRCLESPVRRDPVAVPNRASLFSGNFTPKWRSSFR